MVVSKYIECCICNSSYRLRVGVGFDSFQKHYFDCIDCQQPIVFALRALAPNADVEVVENCKIIGPCEDDIVVNFHPNCAFDVDTLHNPFAFPSSTYLHMIQPFMRMRAGLIQDVSSQFDIPNAPNMWNKVKSILSLTSLGGKEKALQKLVTGYCKERSKVIPGYRLERGDDCITEFLDGVFYPRINDMIEPVLRLVDKLHSESKLTEFYQFYKSNLEKENLERYLYILTEYFKFRDQFGQLSFHARVYDEGVDDKIVGSKNFDQIKLYYGQVYESLTSNFTVLSCLNNVNSGRAFDEFRQMNLNKYIKDLEKAKKHNPFKDSEEFKLFCEDLDSTLRNGSHHASIWRDGEKIMYRSGGTGKERDLPYSRYLHMCNKLTISIAALFLIELHIKRRCSE